MDFFLNYYQFSKSSCCVGECLVTLVPAAAFGSSFWSILWCVALFNSIY